MKKIKIILSIFGAIVFAAIFHAGPKAARAVCYSQEWNAGNGAYGMTIDKAGNVWIAVRNDCDIIRFNPANASGTWTTWGGGCGTGTGQFEYPTGVAVDPNTGNVWVANQYNNNIIEFTPGAGSGTGTYTNWTTYGSSGSGTGQFNSPEHLTVDSSGNVWVADRNNSRIVEFTAGIANGTTGSFASWNTFSAGFDNPEGVAVDSSGNVWVADTNNNRIVEFNPSTFSSGAVKYYGSYAWGQVSSAAAGSIDLGGSYGNGIVLDSSGNVWFTNPGYPRITEFNPSDYLDTWTGFGTPYHFGPSLGPGQVYQPNDLAVDSSGDVFVADNGDPSHIMEFTPGCSVSATVLYNGTAQGGAYLYLRPVDGQTPPLQFYSGDLNDYPTASTLSISDPSDPNGYLFYSNLVPGTYSVMIRKPSAYHYFCNHTVRDNGMPAETAEAYCGGIYLGPPVKGDYVWGGWQNRGTITIAAGKNLDLGVINTTVYGGSAGTTISGTVASDGKPMIGWLVKAATGPIEPLYGELPFPNANSALITSVAKTDSNGNYTLSLPDQAASYYITACSSPMGCQWWGYEGGYGAGAGGTAQAVSVSDGQQETGVNINVP